MTKGKKFKAQVRARAAKTGESYQAALRNMVVRDEAVAIYHVVRPAEEFAESARILFQLVQEAQRRAPGKRRILYLDVQEHRNAAGGFDEDTCELMDEFLVGFLGPHLSAIHTPLLHIEATAAQDDDIPERLEIRDEAGAAH